MFIELKKKESEFYQKYMRSFAARSACTSSFIEVNEEEKYDVLTSLAISNYLDAYDYIFEKNDERITPYILPTLIKKITGGEYDQFRKRDVLVEGSQITRTHAKNIPIELYTLFDNYYHIWSYLEDIYLKEAKFHIQFLLIHPFGDGNGRCARLLTSYNLVNQKYAPIIITSDKKREYCNYIENRDEIGLSQFFKESSEKELAVMQGMYQTYLEESSAKEKVLTKKSGN